MIKTKAKEILNLIKEGKGAATNEVFGDSYLNDEVKKIVKVLTNECKCSLVDSKGNKRKYESDLDISLVEKIVEALISDKNQLNPTIARQLMSDSRTIGPNIPISIEKYIDEMGRPAINIERPILDNWSGIIDQNREKVEELILKPYMAKITKENQILLKRHRFSKFFNKDYRKEISDEELLQRCKQIFRAHGELDERKVENTSVFFIYSILKSKNITNSVINDEIQGKSLIVLGEKKKNTYSGMLHQMSINFLDCLPTIKNPNDSLQEVNKIYSNMMGQLEALAIDIGQTPKKIEEQIKNINKEINRDEKYYAEDGYRNIDVGLRKKDAGFTKRENVRQAMKLYCEQVDNLLLNKDNMSDKDYLKEVSKLHFRFIQIHPFPDENGRTGRALTNILLSEKNMCALFDKREKSKYIRGMNFMRLHLGKEYKKGLYTNQNICSQIEEENIYLLEEYLGIQELGRNELYKDRQPTEELESIRDE